MGSETESDRASAKEVSQCDVRLAIVLESYRTFGVFAKTLGRIFTRPR